MLPAPPDQPATPEYAATPDSVEIKTFIMGVVWRVQCLGGNGRIKALHLTEDNFKQFTMNGLHILSMIDSVVSR